MIDVHCVAEYTPVAYLAADIDSFFGNYSPSQVGQRPALVSIDGGMLHVVLHTPNTYQRLSVGYEQTSFGGFSINGEANLDLEYAMALVGPTQNVTLYQVGDLVEGMFSCTMEEWRLTSCRWIVQQLPRCPGRIILRL